MRLQAQLRGVTGTGGTGTVGRRVRRSILLCLGLGAVLCTAVSPLALAAQSRGDRVTIQAGTALRAAAGGEIIAVSTGPLQVEISETSSDFVQVTLQGHLLAKDVRLTADRTRGTVTPANGTVLRATASRSGETLANLRPDMFVFPERQGDRFPTGNNVTFLEAKRLLWVAKSRLAGTPAKVVAQSAASRTTAPKPVAEKATPAKTPPARASTILDSANGQLDRPAAPAAVASALAPLAGPTLESRGAQSLHVGPKGTVLATMLGGVPLTTLAREDGWVRVRIEGWMPDSAVEAAGAASAGALSAADIRADPAGTRGRVVQWSVESLAFQTADGLRRGLEPGEPYLLARGPGEERAVLYLAIPDSLVARARALAPLARVTVTARVRNGRSQPAGVPILDLLELARP